MPDEHRTDRIEDVDRQLAADLAALERSVLVDDFGAFAARFWSHVEQARELLPSHAIDGIAAVLLEAGTRGGRWAISCPPGVSKSLLCSVLFPAWLLLRTGGRVRIMVASYSHDLAVRDSIRCRSLIESAEYQALVAGVWSLRDDANRLADYWTTTGGRRLIASVGGKVTGERVDVQIIDDAINATDVHSEAHRKEVIRWIVEVLPSRLDDPARATRIIVGQRLHPQDPISVAVDQGWRHLVLPALATEEKCVIKRDDGSLVWRDRRRKGEPLFKLLGREALDRLKKELGSQAFAAQYQQAPHDDESSMFKRAWFGRRWTELPERFDREVIALDASFKASKTSDYAVISVWGAKGPDRYLIEQWRRRAGFSETRDALKALAQKYRYAKVLVESAANGHAVFDQLSKEITSVVEVKPEGGKTSRAASVQAIVEAGAVLLPSSAPWVEDWIDEVTSFPAAKHDDQLDSMVYALRELASTVFYDAYRW